MNTTMSEKDNDMFRPSLVAPTVEIYQWTDHRGTVQGYIKIDEDENGLPILRIEAEDDFYSGVLSHKLLFKLITELAVRAADRRKKAHGNQEASGND